MNVNKKEYAMSGKKSVSQAGGKKSGKVSAPSYPSNPRGAKDGQYEKTNTADRKIGSLGRGVHP